MLLICTVFRISVFAKNAHRLPILVGQKRLKKSQEINEFVVNVDAMLLGTNLTMSSSPMMNPFKKSEILYRM